MTLKGKIEDGELKLDHPEKLKELEGEVNVKITKYRNTRTQRQNRALHKFFELLSEDLNEKGLTVKKTLRDDYDMMWTDTLIKEIMWRPIQKAMYGTKSTKKLKTDQIDDIFDVINKNLGDKGVHVPFPSIKNLMRDY